ncbi:MAG: signal peptide peptidase SppA [Bacteroidales bacterium]|nr:signal peptide peptidase SppA [Bacteroidales bacterium]
MKGFLKTLLAAIIGTFIALFICGFFFIGIIGSLGALTAEETTIVHPNSILRIDFTTPVTESTDATDPLASLQSFNFSASESSLGVLHAVNAIEHAATDPNIEYIYININQFNIGMAAMEEVRNALVKFRESGKPIIAYADNYSTGSYYISSVADKIYINSEGMVQMFGLGSNIMFFKDLLEKLGVEVQLIRHGKFKAAAEQFIASNISKENLEQNQVMLNSIWDAISSDIVESRGIDKAKFNKLIDNLSLSTVEALLEEKIVDQAITRDELIDNLCTLSSVDKEKDLNFISLSKYAKATYTENYTATNKIAVVYADGEITMDADEGLSVKRFYHALRNIEADSTIKAVVLRVSSPGGDAQAAEILNKEIQRIRVKKPVVVSMGEYAASGGYWISANSEKIYADRNTITGSIGVFSMAMNYGKALKKHLDINTAAIKTHKHSDMFGGIRPMNNAEVEFMQTQVETIYTKFMLLVSGGRNLEVDYVDEIAQGRVWTGADGVRIKIVDEIGGIKDAIKYAASYAELEDYKIEEFPKSKTSLEKLMEKFNSADAAIKTLQDPYESIQTAYSDIIKEGNNKVFARLPYVYQFNY